MHLLEHALLESVQRKQKISSSLHRRCQLLYYYHVKGKRKRWIHDKLGMSRSNMDKWLKRWDSSASLRQSWILDYEKGAINIKNHGELLMGLLADKARRGRQPIFSDKQIEQIVSLAATDPNSLGLPYTNWSHNLLKLEAINRGIVETISAAQVGRFLKKT